jgi:hypothetical protein
MSHTSRDDRFGKALAERARARAAEQRAIEAPLRAGALPSGVDRIAAALEAQAHRESASHSTRAVLVPAPTRARRSPLAWLAVAAVPLAAAAAIALAVRARPHPEEGGVAEYTVSVSGHVETERARGDVVFASLEARPDAIQEVILRPRERSATALAAKVLVVRGGVGAPVDVPTEVSEAGVVRFDMPGALLEGASEVRVAIAPPAQLAETTAGAARASGPMATAGRRDAVVVRVPIEAPMGAGAPHR